MLAATLRAMSSPLTRAVYRFAETANRSIFLALTQFRTENRFTLFLELLWTPACRTSEIGRENRSVQIKKSRLTRVSLEAATS